MGESAFWFTEMLWGLGGMTPVFALAIYGALSRRSPSPGIGFCSDFRPTAAAWSLTIIWGWRWGASSAAAVPGPEVQLGRLTPTQYIYTGKMLQHTVVTPIFLSLFKTQDPAVTPSLLSERQTRTGDWGDDLVGSGNGWRDEGELPNGLVETAP